MADAADDHQIKALQTGPERDATDARRAEALLGFVTERRTRILRGDRRTRALGMSSPAAIASSTSRNGWLGRQL
jgi:uncharacterized protein (DUF2345 family)